MRQFQIHVTGSWCPDLQQEGSRRSSVFIALWRCRLRGPAVSRCLVIVCASRQVYILRNLLISPRKLLFFKLSVKLPKENKGKFWKRIRPGMRSY